MSTKGMPESSSTDRRLIRTSQAVVGITLATLVAILGYRGTRPGMPAGRSGPHKTEHAPGEIATLTIGHENPQSKAQGHAPQEGSVRHAHDGKALARAALALTGRVVTEAMKPLEGAEIRAVVQIEDPDEGPDTELLNAGMSCTTSGGDGRFRMKNLAPAKYLLQAQRKGFVSASTEVTLLANGPEAEVVLQLKEGMRISGTVRDDQSRPVREAAILASLLTGEGFDTCMTDSEGRFELSSLNPGAHQIIIKSEEFEDAILECVMTGQEISVSLRRQAWGRIRGRVVAMDAGSAPPGLLVYLRKFSPTGEVQEEQLVENATVRDGAFTLERVRTGRYDVVLCADGYAPAVATGTLVVGDQTSDVGTLTLQRVAAGESHADR